MEIHGLFVVIYVQKNNRDDGFDLTQIAVNGP
jgi:hypothetical protein